MPQGTLFYLIGASGVGKDSLLGYLRSHLNADSRTIIARRHITRPADAGGEPHIEISPQDFQARLRQGGFAMHWRSHGYHYGIDAEIDQFLALGYQVVVNGSRRYLETARSRYPRICPVLVTVSHDRLLGRLRRRGRENEQEIEQRLLRGEALNAELQNQDLIRLCNDAELEAAGRRLLEIIRRAGSITPPEHRPAAATG